MITLRDVSYRYPDAARDALRAIDLYVEESELVVVAGPSGCGKSTLLRLVNGLVPHFHGGVVSGSVRVAGLDPIEVGPRGMSATVGFVHQNPEAHFVTRVVEDELAFAMENHGVAPSAMRRRVEEVLDQLSIAHLRDREIDTLSGGERQRVAIAGVLTLQPRILVLDEPTSQLDPQSADEVLTALRTLNDDLGLTLLLAEHRLERVAAHADRVVRMVDGEIVAVGEPGEALAGSELAPPLVRLGGAFGWSPPSLTIKAARRRPELRRLRERLGEQLGERLSERLSERLAAVDGGADPEDPDAVSGEPAVEARGLWWTYPSGVEGLRGVDLAAGRGTITALLGRNGSGKSTLLKTLVGLIRPERGWVRLRPTPERVVDPLATPLEVVARDVGFVPQNPGRLLFHETVAEELAWSLRQRADDGDDGDDAEDAARRALDAWVALLEIGGLDARHPRELSTGERQRLALVTALAGEPPILLLDEPTRGLDAAVKRRLADGLRRLADGGTTILVATHDVELTAECADRVVLLGGGRVVAEGPTRAMLHDSPVFSTRLHRLFGDPRIHTLDDVLRLLREGPV